MIHSGPSTTYTSTMLDHIISSLNEIKRKDGTKKYQDEIIYSGTFRIFCPIRHQVIYPTYNFFFPASIRSVIYIFEGVERLALISFMLPLGYPIVAATTRSISVSAPFFVKNGLHDSLLNAARSVLSDLSPSTPKIDMNLNPKLICGSRNFSHFLWNELPTIDNCIFNQRKIETYIIRDPFGLCMKSQYSNKLTPIESRSTLRGWNTSLIFTGSSTFVPDKVRLRLLQCIINEHKPKNRRIYITVRPTFLNKSLVNQIDFLCCLIRAFKEKYSDMEFVLDGFSLPDDFDMNTSRYSNSTREQYRNRIKQSHSDILKIIQTVPDVRKNILNITGLNISRALQIISSCSYYISHSGTQHHKIAWLFPRNGFVHSNRAGLGEGPLETLAEKTECALIPTMPGPQYIEDLKTVPDGQSEEKACSYRIFKKKYIIKDIDLIVSQIIEDYSEKTKQKFE